MCNTFGMNKSDFSTNLRKLRRSMNITQLELADKLDVGKSLVSMYEQGKRKPSYEMLETIADFFNVDMSALMGRDSLVSPGSNAVRVPVYGTVPAGIPVEAIENITDYEEIPREMTAGGKEYFGLRVKGDSMIPDFHDGDTVLLIRQSDCENGQVAVACVNGNDATLKKIIKQKDAIILQPLNHAYEPMIYRTNDEENPVTILGVVVEIRRKYAKFRTGSKS